ncbi:MAG TPA: PilN domain-containing protein [bacterium]|nr:PilN domain-containing protein [bacterium]HPN31609.1 PilN domain-containing protein [bacterium]
MINITDIGILTNYDTCDILIKKKNFFSNDTIFFQTSYPAIRSDVLSKFNTENKPKIIFDEYFAALNTSGILYKITEVPINSEKINLFNLIKYEFDKYFSILPDNVYWNYSVVNNSEKTAKILISCAEKKYIDKLLNDFLESKVYLNSIEPAEICALNYIFEKYNKTNFIVFTKIFNTVTFSFVKDKELFFIRNIESVNADISNEFAKTCSFIKNKNPEFNPDSIFTNEKILISNIDLFRSGAVEIISLGETENLICAGLIQDKKIINLNFIDKNNLKIINQTKNRKLNFIFKASLFFFIILLFAIINLKIIIQSNRIKNKTSIINNQLKLKKVNFEDLQNKKKFVEQNRHLLNAAQNSSYVYKTLTMLAGCVPTGVSLTEININPYSIESEKAVKYKGYNYAENTEGTNNAKTKIEIKGNSDNYQSINLFVKNLDGWNKLKTIDIIYAKKKENQFLFLIECRF